MAYTFLDNSLNTIGVLTNKGGQTNDYWGDSITHEIATSQDVLTSVSLSVDKPSVNIDTSGNQKTWNHVIQGLSFNIDGIGRKVNENDYLIYQEGTNGKYYLMAITQVDESAVQSGFHYKTVQGLNAAAYDLSRKTLRAKSFTQIPDNTQEKGTAQNILKYIFDGVNWDVRTIGSFGAVDYDIAEGTTAQAVLLDIIGMFEAEVDAYVKLNNWGKGSNVFNKNGSIKRIFDFSTSLGKYRGETVRYNKNMVSITKTGARDSMYTKLYVNGNNITIADVNNGADYIVDDVANRKYNKLGAVSTPVTYLEGIITNSAIESPTALLAWGKKQLAILNHPRYNYQISATNDDKVQLGDTVIIQDTHASDPIYLKSKVISKTVSLADPVNNSFVVGEFSPIVIGADNGLDDTDQIMQLVNQANQTAVNAQNKANENAQKIEDTRTNLEKTIDDKLTEGKDYADDLNNKAIEEQSKFNNQINQELATAKSERDALSAKTDQMLVSANSYADNMYNNAVAVAKDEASKALSDANTALGEAKEDLTTNLNKEIADRDKAVSVVNSQAQDYATQAKADAIAAANTADGQVRKDFKATTDSLSSTISQNKEDANGKISTAQTTATQALNGLSTKVSQTDYDKKTGDLSTAVNTVTQTANETKDELANVTQTVDSQSAQINTISNTVDGTTQTISDIQTKQGEQSGSINKLETKAEGFEASITKINDFVNSQGQINQLMNTEFTPDLEGWDSYNSHISYVGINKSAVVRGSNVLNITHDSTTTWSRYSQRISTFVPGGVLSASVQARAASGSWNFVIDSYNSAGTRTLVKQVTVTSTNTLLKIENVAIPSDTVDLYYSFWSNAVGTITIAQPMLVFGPTVGDYVQGNYNNNGALAKVKLTADKATLDLSNYKIDADGRISKAQADITATANAVSTKVSQSDYDKKTQDLDTKYGQVKVTADAVTTDVAKYKTDNDKKVSANTASINTLSGLIESKVSQTDYDKKTGELSGKYSAQQQTINSISDSVTELQAKANAQGQVNQLVNTEFTPDFQGWDMSETWADTLEPYRSIIYDGSNTVGLNTQKNINKTYTTIKQLIPFTLSGSNKVVSVSWQSIVYQVDQYSAVHVRSYDANMTKLTDVNVGNWGQKALKTWGVGKFENISIPDNASFIEVLWSAREGFLGYMEKPMLVFADHVGDYVPGNYNNNSRVSALEVSLNGITGTVNDPKNGLSATAKLASDGMTIATKAQNDASSALITANGVQTKVKQMGGINLLVNTEFNPDLEGWYTTTTGTIKEPYRSYWQPDTQATTVGWATQSGSASSYSRLRQDVQLSSTPGSGHQISMSWYSYTGQTNNYNNLYLTFYDSQGNKVGDSVPRTNWADLNGHTPSGQNSWNVQNKWEGIDVPDTATMVNVSFEAREGTSAYLAHPMLVMGSTIGDYVAGNYNNNNSLESTRTQLAGQITDEIKDRKDGDDSVVTQTTKLIDQRVKSVEKGYESAISQSADNIMLSVSTPNRFVNTDFSPNLDGWNNYNNGANGKNYTFYRSYLRNGATVIGINVPSDAGTDSSKYYSYFEQDVAVPGNNGGTVISLSWDATTNKMDNYANLWINFKKADGSDVDRVNKRWDTPVGKGWQTQKWENISVPKDASYIHFSFQTREGANAYLSRPMLTFTSTAQSYMPGAYSNISTNSVLQLQSDYFSLNLHTNSGDIVSSINGDHSGVTITGKHITLDGEVNVTGDFYAKGGNFKNLNAANITGDIATFIKSGFNDAFGSYTTLDAKGMQISTGGGVTQYSGQYAWFYNYNGSTLESIGRFGSSKSPWNPNNVDYMEIAVSTWRGAAQGGAKGNGGDGIMFAAYDPDMNETRLLTWETSLSAGYHGLSSGWNFWDNINFNGNKIVVPSADWHVSFSGMTLGQTGSTYPSIVEANEHKTGISFGLHEVYLLIDGKSYPMSPKIK